MLNVRRRFTTCCGGNFSVVGANGEVAVESDEPDATPDVHSDDDLVFAYAQEVTRSKEQARRTRRNILVASAAVVLTLVLTLVAIGASGPGSKDAAAQVELGARTTLAKNTVAIQISGSFTVDGRTVPITGSGAADLSSHLEDLSMSFAANGTSIEETLLADGNAADMQITENGQNEIETVLPGKDWVQLPLDSSSDSGSTNILSQLQVLTHQGNTVTSLGSSTINGASVTGYQVTIGKKAMAAAYKKAVADGGADASVLENELKNITIKPPTISLWIGSNNLLAREEVALSIGTAGTSVAGDMTMDFSDYGVPVSVSVPASSDVASYDDFLAAAKAAS
jgi:hypothetical protein